MKLSCKVIEDMLPMYYDKVCSEESAALVEEHLRSCPRCGQMLADLGAEIEIPEQKVAPEKIDEMMAGFTKEYHRSTGS